ncbi:MAG: TIGR03767 family metallophosphoesterase [Candidatus Dormibacteraeota bacterium]|nr:TIGR03767 family metallophosphoesterase [Candidatus Dormibacteraeota bacterium]
MSAGPALSIERRLAAGAVERTPSPTPYRAVAAQPGEPQLLRPDLVGSAQAAGFRARGKPLACFAQVTDLHLADVQSPARFEFLNREFKDPRFRRLVPMQRPQEALNAHSIAALVATLNRLETGPAGGPLELVAMTGDAIDNAQWNELTTFLALFNGGTVSADSGRPGYEGVQAPGWPDDIFWKPDGQASDKFRTELGYPHLPGLLERALRPFSTPGLQLPWLGCHGNHELLSQGVGKITPDLVAALTGGVKPVQLPDGFDLDRVHETYVSRPEAFMEGPVLPVTPDPARRAFSRAEFIRANQGHGFGGQELYYVHDTPAVRYVVLATSCSAGGADGVIDPAQYGWLESRLGEVPDRLIVILSHHGLDSLTNTREPGVEPAAVLGLLLRHPNVMLWLNGHVHANRVTPRAAPGGEGGGFWEVTTASLVDWPCQGRLVEIVDGGPGLLGIACTMLDHDGLLERGSAESSLELAGLHRELAANLAWSGFTRDRSGSPQDRNVILPLRKPFPTGGPG